MIEIAKLINYQPSGFMCATCLHKHRDCSHLKFKEMRVIGTYRNGDKKVKCVEFKRASEWTS